MPASHTFNGGGAEAILKHSRDAVAEVWGDVRSFEFKWVVPYQTAFSATTIRNPIIWMTLLAGFIPLLAGFVVEDLTQLLTWLLTYFALAWMAYFYVVVAKRDADLPSGAAAAAFTLLVGYQAVLWTRPVPPLSLLYDLTTVQNGPARLVGFVFGVGVHEEAIKSLPVLLLAFLFSRVRKPIDGLFYGTMVGVTFAVREAYHFIAHAHNTNAVLYQALLRTTTLPFLHATWTGIAGYFIGLSTVSVNRRAALCITGIALAAVLHGSYDAASEHVVSIVIAAATYLLFVSYIARSQEMLSQLQSAGTPTDRAFAPGPCVTAGAAARPDAGGLIQQVTVANE